MQLSGATAIEALEADHSPLLTAASFDGVAMDIPGAAAALAAAFSVADGSLACDWTPTRIAVASGIASHHAYDRLTRACLSPAAAAAALHGPNVPDSPEALDAAVDVLLTLAASTRVGEPSRVRSDGVWLAPRLSPADATRLASSLLVLAHVRSMTDDMSAAGAVLDAALQSGLNDSRLFCMRSQLRGFSFNQLAAAGAGDGELAACAAAMEADADAALKLDPNNLEALFSKGFALRSTPGLADLVSCITVYERYLAAAERDDRQRPAAHFHLGLARVVSNFKSGTHTADQPVPQKVLNAARTDYENGVAAETARLPFFDAQAAKSKGL